MEADMEALEEMEAATEADMEASEEMEAGMEALEEMEADMEALEEMEADMEALEEMEAEGTLPWEMDLIHEDLQPATVDLEQNCLRVCQDTRLVSLLVQDSCQRNQWATFILKSFREKTWSNQTLWASQIPMLLLPMGMIKSRPRPSKTAKIR